MSDITGFGYGDSHNWIRGNTAQVGSDYMNKGTFYQCECGVSFVHKYDLITDIFQAIQQSGVPSICPLAKKTGGYNVSAKPAGTVKFGVKKR